MAEAKLVTKTVQRVVYDKTDIVKLELTMEEAKLLAYLMGNYGGSVKGSPREHTDAIGTALNEAGVTGDDLEIEFYNPGYGASLGCAYFKDYEK